MNKKELMVQLLNLYEQVDSMPMSFTQLLVCKYIKKLELMLKDLL